MSFPFSMTYRPLTVVLALSGALLISCGKAKPLEISLSRPLTESERKPVLGATSQERFQFAMPGPAMTQASDAPAAGPHLEWDVPPGWKETPHPMRDVSLSFGEGGECSVVRAGGTLLDNVNRWRKQMGLPEITAEEAGSLPTRPLLGGKAYATSLDGSYQSMGAAAASPDYRMIGVILPVASENASIFVKMVGPRKLVEENQAAFEAFCDSLRIVTS